MEADRWQRVKDVFANALELDSASRASYLAEACAGDDEVRAEVESLLAAHDTTDDGFIEKPAVHREIDLPPEPVPVSWIGRKLGVYRIVDEVGRGGMSEVYRAVRDDEYHKEVAIKVLRRGYDTASLLRRFRIETQILATLDHPNIARLLDAGSTEEGLPYLVMDYIEGQPIDAYCRTNRLSLRARLDLFRELCGAVQYVHQHLMVHGDLKCSNVLVSRQGKVKLLDFGIARLLSPSPTGDTLPADAKPTALVALTPEYASPEQIRGGPITTASDVYSLGVMLYHLLTGVLPHRVQGVDFPFEIASRILERDAVLPSIAAKSHESGGTTGFGRQLRGDLDNIVMMALEKDPARRYPSVEKLDDDVRRHLEGFPVSARRAGFLYQLGKFMNRHRAGVAVAATIVLILVGGIVATLRQAQIAEIQRQRAQRHFDEVRKLANVFMFDVHNAIQDLPGATSARRLLVQNSLTYLEGLTDEAAGDPSLLRELASAYEKLADVQGGFRLASLGDTEGAIASYRRSLALRESLAAAFPKDRELLRELLRSHGKLSEILAGEGRLQEAIPSSRTAANLAQQLVSMPGASVVDRRNVGTTLLGLGWQLAQAGQIGDGVLAMRQAAALFEALHAEFPEDMLVQRNLSLSYGRLGETLVFQTDQHAEALEVHEKSYAVAIRILQADPRNTRVQKIVAFAHLGKGAALYRLGRYKAALAEQLKATDLLASMLKADPANEVARSDLALAHGEVASTLIAIGEITPAQAQLTEALSVLSGSSGLTAADLTYEKVLLGLDYYRLGATHALLAGAAGTSSSRRNAACDEARRWLALSQPILVSMETSSHWQWRGMAQETVSSLSKHFATCGPVLTATQ